MAKLKLTPERSKAICAALAAGASRDAAARHGGLNAGSVRRYLARARALTDTDAGDLTETERQLVDFGAAYEAADVAAEIRLGSIIAAAAETDWRAAAWLLPRRFPGRWSMQSRLELTGETGGHLDVDTSGVLVEIGPYLAGDKVPAAS